MMRPIILSLLLSGCSFFEQPAYHAAPWRMADMEKQMVSAETTDSLKKAQESNHAAR